KLARLESMKELVEHTRVTAATLEQIRTGEAPIPTQFDEAMIGQTLAQVLKRPEIKIEQMAPVLRELKPVFFEREEIRENPRESVAALSSTVRNELKSVETEIKYEGYLLQQQRAMERMKKSEQRSIPGWFDYRSVSGLSHEM